MMIDLEPTAVESWMTDFFRSAKILDYYFFIHLFAYLYSIWLAQ